MASKAGPGLLVLATGPSSHVAIIIERYCMAASFLTKPAVRDVVPRVLGSTSLRSARVKSVELGAAAFFLCCCFSPFLSINKGREG